MGRLAALGVLFCVCAGGCTSFIQSDTHHDGRPDCQIKSILLQFLPLPGM